MSDIIPVQIDYTSRDYDSLRSDLIQRVQRRIPEWSADDPSDFGLALVEAFAYLGDLMSYYIDRTANESTLSTAARRDSVIALASDLGYSPFGYNPARVLLAVTNSSDEDLILPGSSVISASVDSGDAVRVIPFETTEAVTVESNSLAFVEARQVSTVLGLRSVGELLGVSDGTPGQRYLLVDVPVVTETIRVFISDGFNDLPWTRVDSLSEYGPLDRVYRAFESSRDTYTIQFGDGVSGQIPPVGAGVNAVYEVTFGAGGNVPAGTINSIDAVPGLSPDEVAALSDVISVTNDVPAEGGSDAQSTESIRSSAAQVFRTSTRAVTVEDYENAALAVSGVGKASAFAESPDTVVVAVAPFRSPGPVELRPGFSLTTEWEETSELEFIVSQCSAELSRRSLAGVSVAVIGPTYVDVHMGLVVTLPDEVRQSDALILIQQKILSTFDYSSVPFGAEIYPSDLVSLVASLGPAIVTVEVSQLTLDPDAENEVLTVNASVDEILVISAANLSITLSGGTT